MSLKTVEDAGKGSDKRPGDQVDISYTDVVNDLKRLNAHNDGIYTKITKRFLANPEFLKLAYAHLKSKDGNLTPGGDPAKVTLDGITEEWFKESAKKIELGIYSFDIARRINIKKKTSKKTRTLTIGNPRDKIIQKAYQMILNEIYENKDKVFLRCSHGFRPNKSAHTALKQIKKE
jgi:RNA-directed DNA polymerase